VLAAYAGRRSLVMAH